MGTPINPFFGRIASLRGARNPHVPGRTFRLLCAARLALQPENSDFKDCPMAVRSCFFVIRAQNFMEEIL